MTRDLIQGKLNRSKTEEKMVNLQFRNTRKVQSGGDRSSPPRHTATLEEPEEPEEWEGLEELEEQAQEETRGRHADTATERNPPTWTTRRFGRN